MNPDQQPWQQPSQQPPAQPTPPPAAEALPPLQAPAAETPSSADEPQYTVDYLDQISAPVAKRRSPNKLILLIFILLGLLLAVGVLAMLLSSRPSTLDHAMELNARLETLAKLSESQHRYLRDNDLRANNTAYQLFLSNAISDLKAPLASAGIKKETTKAIANKEKAYASQLSTEFEDARLNVVLDRTYARQMAYELEIVRSMMRRIYNGNSNTELRGYLDSANANLVPIAKSFEKFASSS